MYLLKTGEYPEESRQFPAVVIAGPRRAGKTTQNKKHGEITLPMLLISFVSGYLSK
jgi:predicted AAA+ superfamily ATPase